LSYIDPHTVLSPRSAIRATNVLYDRGPVANSWSVALLHYWDGTRKLGMRWNGDENSKLGNPQSHATATWFVIPDELAAFIQERVEQLSHEQEGGLLDGYRAMSQDQQHELEAHEWAEGLIGDATDQKR
jgi:hypothetical protein